MNRQGALIRATLIAAVAAPAVLMAQTPPRPQVPLFRSTSTSVSVDVSVRAGNNTVTGLAPEDFVLTDNGVRQTVDAADLDAVPVDISLVVDVSGSTADRLNQYRTDVVAIAATIRPQDRLRVITFASDPKEILALQPSGAVPAVDDMDAGQSSSVYDGIAAALIRKVDLDRRHLIVAFTDGLENSSILTVEMMMNIAKQSESVLHLSGSTFAPMNEVAEATGGANHLAPMPPPAVGRPIQPPIRGSSMVKDFEKIFAAFRQSYVLRFRPTGVAPTGWHEIKVTLARRGRFDIRARRGYFGGR